MQIGWVTDSVGGELAGDARMSRLRGHLARELGRVRTDSREVERGDLFVALRGPNYDGHDFVAESFRRGAGAALVERGAVRQGRVLAPRPAESPLIAVEDTRRALCDLSQAWRRTLPVRVVGVTGSCGKTSTKNILHHVLEESWRTVASERSYNNDIGVPLTLLRIQPGTEVAIVEMGTNGPGEIERLAGLAQPQIGIVTNVFEAHLEGLGSLDGVAVEKSSLIRALPADGVAILNADCPRSAWLRTQTEARVRTVGLTEGADYRATEVSFSGLGTSFVFRGRRVTIPLTGTHFVHNVLFALAVADHLGMPMEAIAERLREIPVTPGRMERKSAGPFEILDDSYNASPASVRAALQAVQGLGEDRPVVLVLGDMLELGERSTALHRELASEIQRYAFARVVTVGRESRAIHEALNASGGRAGHFEDAEDLLPRLGDWVQDGDRVLVKGSNALGLKRVVRELVRVGEERGSAVRTVPLHDSRSETAG